VVASGTATLGYQWQKNGANISGAIAASYTTPATTSTDNGSTFQAVVSNSAGSITSSAATLTVNPAVVAPTITAQPASQTVTAGQTATFAVVASGTGPLGYQWQKNGGNISGATSPSYTTPATTSTDNASTFRVEVSNSSGSITSSAATLTVNPAVVAPTITAQPASQTVTAGQTATFAVAANGTAPLSYQWQKNGANISGATSPSYTTPATTSIDNASTFLVVVSNSAGSVTSSVATLTVNPAAVAPTITVQPTSQTVTAGQTATFAVVASGTATLGYQWQKNGANISGAIAASYTTPATTSTDNGSTFQAVVSNSAGSITSSAATLTVNPAVVAPTITAQPASQTVTAGQTATFAVVASGTGPLGYQWQKNGGNISGATSPSYTTPATTSTDNASTFRVVVSNSAGSITSSAATLTVNPAAVAPTIAAQPSNQTVTAGQTATFAVVASGTAPLSYQWQKNGVNISGATSPSYITPATTSTDNASTFQVVVSNSAGSVTSSAATLTVNPAAVAPTITAQPSNQTVTAGQTATFAVVASGTAPLSYQWQKNGVNISGATSPSYITPATTSTDNASTFQVVVSNSAGSVTSSAATLTVNPAAVAPTITAQPSNQTVTAGQTATFAVVASGTAPLSYQWQKNGVNISGATSASYTTPATTRTDNASTFQVVVSNSAGSVTSSAATLTVNPAAVAPTITVQPSNQTVTAGQTATFSVVATGTAPLSYQWQKNGANISGATSASYTTPATTNTDNASTFQVVVSNSAGSITSSAATLTVNPAAVAPTITVQPSNQTVTAGQTATFSVVATGTAPLSYQWQKNGANISGATSASYTTPATTSTDNASTFQVVVSNSAGSITSSAATLTVTADTTPPTVSITSPTSGSTVSGTITVTASASDNVAVSSVQLQVDGTNVGAADTSSPYNFSLNTTTLSNGSHELTAVAVDTSGNHATSIAIPVTVSNQTGGETVPTYALNGAACSINDTPGSGATDSVFTYTCPLPNPTGAGNLLVVMLRWQNSSSPTASFTDEVSNTYTQATTCTDTPAGTVTGLYYVQNTKAGARNITVHFSSFSGGVAMGEYEFYNVAQSSALDQASCQVGIANTTVSSGAIPVLGSSGDLVFQYGMVDAAAMITGCTPSTQANITWTQRTTMILDNQPQCAQYGIYSSTASFSPSFTVNTNVAYVSAAAAFKAANAGTAPPSGIRVAYVQHDNSIVQNLTRALTQMPISGNLAVIMYTGSDDYPTAISDGTNTWSTVGPNQVCNEIISPPEKTAEGQCSSIWYASVASPGTYKLNFTRQVNSQGAGFGDSYITFDISGAAASPVDTGFGSGGGLASATGQQVLGSGGPVTTITAAPSGTNEVILVSENQQFDTMTGLTSPSGAYFLSNTYTTESNSSHADLNGGWGLLYNGSSIAPETWMWIHDASQDPGINTWTVLGVAFQPANP